MKIRVQGYKLNNYDASYQPANFFFEERYVDGKQRNIKVTNLESGIEFWFAIPLQVETPRQKPKRNKLGYNNISRKHY